MFARVASSFVLAALLAFALASSVPDHKETSDVGHPGSSLEHLIEDVQARGGLAMIAAETNVQQYALVLINRH